MDFVTRFEKALRKRYQHLKTELAKIEHLIVCWFSLKWKEGALR